MDLPIYSDSILRSSLQFADLARFKVTDAGPAWDKADAAITQMEGAANLPTARERFTEISKSSLLEVHRAVFDGSEGAGRFRTTELRPLYRGQDCAPPEFIERSLDNLISWTSAESFNEIHPIEKCALAMTRIADIWPFEFGNLTIAVMAGNVFLRLANLTPFFVERQHMQEFEKTIAQSLSIETQPLINAIYKTVRREMETLGSKQ